MKRKPKIAPGYFFSGEGTAARITRRMKGGVDISYEEHQRIFGDPGSVGFCFVAYVNDFGFFELDLDGRGNAGQIAFAIDGRRGELGPLVAEELRKYAAHLEHLAALAEGGVK